MLYSRSPTNMGQSTSKARTASSSGHRRGSDRARTDGAQSSPPSRTPMHREVETMRAASSRSTDVLSFAVDERGLSRIFVAVLSGKGGDWPCGFPCGPTPPRLVFDRGFRRRFSRERGRSGDRVASLSAQVCSRPRRRAIALKGERDSAHRRSTWTTSPFDCDRRPRWMPSRPSRASEISSTRGLASQK